jgi:hypothetical protein
MIIEVSPVIAPSSKGPPMMTRGRAHPLTVEEPIITMTVVGTYFARFLTCRYSFFCFSRIYYFVARTFLNRIGRCAGKLVRPMVTKVADNRMIYATDVYQVTLEFPEVDFLLISFFPCSFLLEL